jgi:predicted metallopeptidase
MFRNKRKKGKIEWTEASDIDASVTRLKDLLDISWIDRSRIFCVRSSFANTRAYARIWGLGKIWQITLHVPPAYIIEVISEKFDKLSDQEKDKVLLHEITHIPKNFSGALVPHIRHGNRRFEDKVGKLVGRYLKNR